MVVKWTGIYHTIAVRSRDTADRLCCRQSSENGRSNDTICGGEELHDAENLVGMVTDYPTATELKSCVLLLEFSGGRCGVPVPNLR